MQVLDRSDARVEFNVARTPAEVERLRPAWRRLQQHPNADIDFYLTIVNARQEVERPFVLELRRDGQTSMIVAGRIERRPFTFQIGYKVIQGPRLRTLMILYGGVMGQGEPGDHERIVNRLQSLLRAGEFDLVFFNHLDVNSPMYAALSRARPRFCRADASEPNPHHRLTLAGSYADYQATLSKNTRKTLRRYGRKLAEDWGDRAEVRCYRDPADLDIIMNDAEIIASRTYQRGIGVGFEAGEAMRRRLARELERGWLRAYFLYLGGRPAVFSFIDCYGEVAFANETGYDPDFAEWRVGHALNERVIEDLCADPAIRAMDFGFGDAEYKRAICDQVWNETPVYLFSPTPRGMALRALHSGVGLVCRVGKNLAGRARLLPSLKRRWRRRSAAQCLEVMRLIVLCMGGTQV